MKTKITAILIFILLTSTALPVYYTYRSANLEKKHIELLAVKNSSLKQVADKLNSEQSPDSEKLKKLFNELILQDNSIAAIALTDRMERLRFMAKNDAILNSGRIVDELVSDIKEKKFSEAGEKFPVVKNYNGTDWITDKFFIYRFSSGGQSTIAVYSFRTDRLTGIRLALEVILLISGIFILTTGIIMLMRKAGVINDSGEYRIKTIVIGERSTKPVKTPSVSSGKTVTVPIKEKSAADNERYKTASQIDENELSLLTETSPVDDADLPDKMKKTEEDYSSVINRKVLTLFKKIHRQMSPESISLYIKTTERRLSKSYELKGKSIIRIDSLTYDSIPVSETGKINKPGAYITSAGDAIRVPLLFEGEITGLINIEPDKNTSTVNISIDQSDIADMANAIHNYITSSNLITDAETGYYSSRYFVNRVTESIHEALTEAKEFTLLMINIFAGVDADRKQKDMILKVIHPELKKAAGTRNPVFLHKDCICLVLNSPESGCSNIEAALIREISKFRLKVSDDIILKMNPQSIMRYSADSRNLNNILHEVEALAAVSN
jgi:hypothetical protein